MLTIIVLGLIGYGVFAKLMETRQIEAISNVDGITYKELQNLIEQIKR